MTDAKLDVVTVADIRRLNVKPGEVLLITLPDMDAKTFQQAADYFNDALAETLPGVRTIIVNVPVELAVINADQARLVLDGNDD